MVYGSCKENSSNFSMIEEGPFQAILCINKTNNTDDNHDDNKKITTTQ